MKYGSVAAVLCVSCAFCGLTAHAAAETAAEPANGSITVTVVTVSGGAAVPGATVWCTNAQDYNGDGLNQEIRTGQTGADGKVTFENLNHGWHSIRVQKGDAGAWKHYIDTFANEPHAETTVSIGLFNSIRGVVTDENRNSLPDVHVTDRHGIPCGMTDADGRFCIPNIEWDHGNYEFTFTKPGYTTFSNILFRNPEALTIILFPAGQAIVTILDGTGRPVPDCSVFLQQTGTDYPYMWHVRTGKDGVVTTPWIAADTPMILRADRFSGRIHERVEHEFRVAAGETQRIMLRTSRVTSDPSKEVFIRAVTAKRGQSVVGEVLIGDSEASLKNRGKTDPGGWFFLEAPAESFCVLVEPEDPLLYQKGGPVTIDRTVKGFTGEVRLIFERGCAISGQIRDENGTPLGYKEVIGIPEGKVADRKLVRTDEQGRFVLAHLSYFGHFYEIRVNAPVPGGDGKEDRRQVRTVTSPRRGETLDGVDFVFEPWEEPDRASRQASGKVTYTDGSPVPGAVISFAPLTGDETMTDDEGAFIVKYAGGGKTQVRLQKTFSVWINNVYDTEYAELHVTEGAELSLPEDGSADTLHIVAEKPPLRYAAGQVMDEEGRPLEVDTMYSGESIQGSMDDRNGRFAKIWLRDEPIVFEIRKQGYQTRFIQSGRDFQWGDTNLRVTIKKGPFPEGQSIFTAMTGLDDTPEGVAQLLNGQRVKKQEEFYAQIAAWQPPAPPQERRVRVLDPKGMPCSTVQAMFVHVSEPAFASGAAGLMYTRNVKGAKTLTSEDGVFTITASGAVFWTGDSARTLYVAGADGDTTTIPEITLPRPATIQIHVLDEAGKPAAGVHIRPPESGLWIPEPMYGDEHQRLTHTDAYGNAVFEDVVPGNYVFVVGRPGQMGRAVVVEARAGRTQTAEVTLTDPAADNRSREIVAQFPFRGGWLEGPAQQDWEKQVSAYIGQVSGSERAELERYIIRQLDQASKVWLNFSEGPRQLAGVVRAFGFRSALPALKSVLAGEGRHPSPYGAANNLWDTTEIARVIASMEGERAVPFFTRAAHDDKVGASARTAAIIGLGMTGSDKGVKAFIGLRDAAWGNPGAPQRKDSYTNEEKMTETVLMAFHGIPGVAPPTANGAPPNRFNQVTGAWVSEDYLDGRLGYGHIALKLRHYGTEWIIVDVNATPPPMP